MKNRVLTVEDILRYEAHLREEERAVATIEKYLHDVRAFAAWMSGGSIDKESTAAWKSALLADGLSAATVNTRLAALNGLLHFLGWDDCRVRFLKVQRKAFRDAGRELTRHEYRRLLETADGETSLLLETICAAGIRVSELRYITVEAARAGRADVALKGKVRTILLPEKLCRRLLKHAKQQKIASGPIFRGKGGKELSRFQIWKRMKMLAKKAGITGKKVFPHNLRHLFAVSFYQATHDVVKLADLLGHSSVNTTRIYLLTTGREHTKTIEQLGLLR